MWTKAANDAELTRETISSSEARKLFFQARVNLELFNHAREKLKEALDQLKFHDFARVNSCHMTEGIFGADIHLANMQSERERVIGFLLAAVTAGHRFTRSMIAVRRSDAGRDWKSLRLDISQLGKKFHKTRNFLEHLDEAIAEGRVNDDMDCSFTPGAVLTCKENGNQFTFDFSEQALTKPQEIYDKIIEMLEQRKAATTAGS
jgi:hypothetical protein